MAQFTDDAGRTWTVKITMAQVKDVKRALGFSVVPLSDAALRMSADTELLVNTIYLCCRDEADAAGVTDEDFGRSLRNSIKQAADALLQAMTDFLPTADRGFPRKLLAAIDGNLKSTHN